jgi:hypothetical protein
MMQHNLRRQLNGSSAEPGVHHRQSPPTAAMASHPSTATCTSSAYWCGHGVFAHILVKVSTLAG